MRSEWLAGCHHNPWPNVIGICNEDELFMVVKGQLTIKFRDKDVILDEGELIVIPKGVDHLPVAAAEVHVMLIEPKGTLNTGNVVTEKTKEVLEKI